LASRSLTLKFYVLTRLFLDLNLSQTKQLNCGNNNKYINITPKLYQFPSETAQKFFLHIFCWSNCFKVL